jgi:ubiquitin C-terminal hydrolase
MQASFCIWLASNSHEWAQPPLVGTHENPVENQRIKSTELNTCDPTATVKQTLLPSKSVLSLVPSSQSLDSTPFVAKANPDSPVVADPDKPHSSKRDANARSEASFPHSPKSKEISAPSTGKIRTGRKRPAGLVNIGNTYANSLLQAFRCIPEFLSLYELHPTLSTDFSESLLSTLRQIKSKSEIFTPHAFLKSLKVIVDVIANLKLPPNRPRYNFNFNRQHDAADILNYIFRDLTGVSSLAKESIETKLQVSHVCNKCFGPVTREESYPILTVPMAPTVEEAINKHLADEYLFGKNKAFCDQCGRKRVITIETRITHAPETLVVQMQRFTDDQTRDLSIVNVFPDSLTVKAVSDGLIIKHKYNLRATVNHIGSLTAGHYWSYVALSKSTWLKCDDDRVTEISKRELNNDTSYLFFFSRLGCFPS